MSFDLVFNDRSHAVAENVFIAWSRMEILCSAMLAASRAGVGTIVRTSAGFSHLILAKDYLIAQWLNDPAVDEPRRRLVRSRFSRSPLLLPTDVVAHENALRSDATFGGQPSPALHAAYCLDAAALSFATGSWNAPVFLLSVVTLDDVGESLVETTVIVRNVAVGDHAAAHQLYFHDKMVRGVRDGADLWERRAMLLPGVSLCADVERQLIRLRAGSLEFRPVLRHLIDLSEAAMKWQPGAPFGGEGLGAFSDESEATMNAYGDCRTFECPDGVRRVFRWHIKLGANDFRIHFLAESPGNVIVGYVGEHLPTAR